LFARAGQGLVVSVDDEHREQLCGSVALALRLTEWRERVLVEALARMVNPSEAIIHL
jgi:hypothetical protein